ncbi:hypothetical protein ACFL6T_05140 [Candidatus Zixiibacteriota bacterium]
MMGGAVNLDIFDESGQWVAEVQVRSQQSGINRAVWNLQYSPLYTGPEEERSESSGISGILVLPGRYTVRLDAGGVTTEQTVEVSEDPRLPVTEPERRAWTEKLLSLSGLSRASGALAADIREAVALTGELRDSRRNRELQAEAAELDRMGRELNGRIRRLAGEISGWTGLPTTDQLNEEEYFRMMVTTLLDRLEALTDKIG